MLKQLHIRNFAIIDELDLQFHPGMTVFTGETGAGKSILIGALGLVLGDRADTTIIRSETQGTEITAIFDINSNLPVQNMLAEQALESELDELLIRRVINKDGRSRAYINSTPVTAQSLRDIGEFLIDIHGQHAHQSLLKRDVQRELLDAFGDYSDQLEQVAAHFENWHTAGSKLTELSGASKDHAAQLALLQYQVQELQLLDPQTGEYEELEDEFKRLENAERLQETAQRSLSTINEDEYSITTRLGNVIRELQDILQFDKSLNDAIGLLDNAAIQLDEATTELRSYLDRMDIDPEKTREVEKRLNDLHEMARKHHIQPQLLTEHLGKLNEQLDSLENNQQLIEELQQQQALALKQYLGAAEKLYECRYKTAEKMSGQITARIKKLGMPDGRFNITVDRQDAQPPRAIGNDQIEFMVTANAGQSLLPLRKVASGGELSRISLAIQVTGNSDRGIIPTLVFDEVDAGIGGGVAEIVGKLLHGLAKHRQIFCVTHLPQVAAHADNHLQVEKSSNKIVTTTSVSELSKQQRVEEIARMLGGLKITRQSREHAKEMLQQATSS